VPDIHIHREHRLGLPKARQVATQWAAQARDKFDMQCRVVESADADTVHFTRAGVQGSLRVAADHFNLDAKLGFLLGAFTRTIEAEIEKTLDALLAAGAKDAARPKRGAPAKKSAPRPPK
jgi:putative polyhydroxyalkanoate system protein